jgi:hypothetical protein
VCITLAHLPQEIGGLFTRAFGPDGAGSGRPDGRQWIAELDALASRLMICSGNKAHLFFNGLSSCPWCLIESSGVLLFVDYTIVDTSTGFSIEPVWSRILGVPSPGAGNAPSLLTYLSVAKEFGQAARAAEARVRGLQHAWLCEASGEEFNAKRDELRALTEEYRKLPE